MRRSGQCLFLPRAVLKQGEKASVGHFLFCVAAIYMLKKRNKSSFLVRGVRGTGCAW